MATVSAQEQWRPKLRGKCIPYLRSSPLPYSRFDIVAQRRAIEDLISAMPARLLPEFVEIEPLEKGRRPALEKAIAECRAQNATLIFGRLDRMRRSVHWLEHIYANGIDVAAADIPHFNKDEYWKLYNKQHGWRLRMGERVSEALLEAKERGVALGSQRGDPENLKKGPAKSVEVRFQTALRRDYVTMSKIVLLRHRGITSLAGIAKRLNQMKHQAPRGGLWTPTQVSRVIKRIEELGK